MSSAVRYVSWAYQGGYGIAAQGYLRALLRAGIDVSWTPLFPVPGGWAPAQTTAEAVEAVAALADPDDPDGYFGTSVRTMIGRTTTVGATVLHTIPELWPDYRSTAYTIGNTVWETDALPPHWPALLNGMDYILVPSGFNAKVFREGGVTRPVEVVPHAVVPRGPAPTEREIEAFRARHEIPVDDFVFYCIDAWDARKAPWKTLSAYLGAFEAHDPVTFVLKTTAQGPRSGADPNQSAVRPQVDTLVRGHASPARAVLIDEPVPAADIALLHHIGECYVSLTHGEGWGLGAFEAASHGNAVITTGWGATLDYLGEDWPYLVAYEMGPVMNARGLPSYQPTQRWALPDHDHARELLRSVYEDHACAAGHAAELCVRIHERFGEEAVAARLLEVLARVGVRLA